MEIVVTPVNGPREDAGLLLVAFADRPEVQSAAGPWPGVASVDEELVRQLERELKVTREELKGTIEELEGANEELKAATKRCCR